ncbi:hypothetical protein C8R43DRAFT_961292 [Mycena crocata]|nr:hypothetical protein C8R43DRAFT_961292 [Mycena crocata]
MTLTGGKLHNQSINPNSTYVLIGPWLHYGGEADFQRTHGAELRRLCAMPGADGDEPPMLKLEYMIMEYYVIASHNINKTFEGDLKRLNCPHPDEYGVNSMPLSTEYAYSNLAKQVEPVIRLVAALLRTSADLKFGLSKNIKETLGEIEVSLTLQEEGQADMAALHQLFMLLWTANWEDIHDCRFPDPTMCFLALSSLEETGNLPTIGDLIQASKKLRWGIQMAMLNEMHIASVDGHTDFDPVAPYVVTEGTTTFASLYDLGLHSQSIVDQMVMCLIKNLSSGSEYPETTRWHHKTAKVKNWRTELYFLNYTGRV